METDKKLEENIHANHRERMLERFLKDPDSLNDHEILEILLYSVIKRKDTNPLAHKILSYFSDLNGVFNATETELLKIDGVGKKVASEILALSQVIKRCEKIKANNVDKTINSLRNIFPMIEEVFKNERTEKFVLFTFDEKKKYKNKLEILSDNYASVKLDKAKIVDFIGITKPHSVIIAHNHPYGLAEPSNEDDLTTIKLEMLLSLHGVTLLDHIIYDKNGDTFSYFTEGRLQNIRENCNLDEMIKKNLEQN